MDEIKILVINLKKREDRWLRISNMLSERSLDFERIDAIDCQQGYIGCVLSHIKSLEYAKSKGLKEVIIMEDDFMFQGDGKFIYPPACDVCLYSGNILSAENIENPDFERVLSAQQTEFYFIREHYYDCLIKCWCESLMKLLCDYQKDNYIDIYWKRLMKKDTFICPVKRLGIQVEGFSDIKGRNIDRSRISLT